MKERTTHISIGFIAMMVGLCGFVATSALAGDWNQGDIIPSRSGVYHFGSLPGEWGFIGQTLVFDAQHEMGLSFNGTGLPGPDFDAVARVHLLGYQLRFKSNGYGIIYRSPDPNSVCWKQTISDAGALVVASTTCP